MKFKNLITLFLLFLNFSTFGFEIGAGKADITHLDTNRAMMGYGRRNQTPMAVKNQLYSRAFVFKQDNVYAAYVIIDMQGVSPDIKNSVLKNLNEKAPGLFTEDNLMIAATHNHSAPGGFSHYELYDITSKGYDAALVKKVSDGITQSLLTALKQMVPGKIFFNQEELGGISANRSMQAHLADPASKQVKEINNTMYLLKFLSASGKEIGLLNWFAVHGTSISSRNRYITTDNKGLASALAELYKPEHFVAGFANNEEGDVAPLQTMQRRENGYDIEDDWTQVDWNARLQLQGAVNLYDNATEEVAPQISYAHQWVHMPSFIVNQKYTGLDHPQKLCQAAVGISFTAGTEDGPSYFPGIYEGMRRGEFKGILYHTYFLVVKWFAQVVKQVVPTNEDVACHGAKPIFISTGENHKKPWTPDMIPFQIIRLGQIAILGVPSEMTTNAGYYLRMLVLEKLKNRGVKEVIISGLSNSYSNYVTTPAEYQQQHYEGASTLFGPYTFSAYLQIFDELSGKLKN